MIRCWCLTFMLLESLCGYDLACRFFLFNDTATTDIYTLSLHDALPIYPARARHWPGRGHPGRVRRHPPLSRRVDRKSTRLNSSHANISYAVFCLKKKIAMAAFMTPKNHQMNIQRPTNNTLKHGTNGRMT